MKDVRLVKKAKKGNKEALIMLIMDNKMEYYKLAYTYMKNKEDSLDALQEMIVILYEKIHTLKNFSKIPKSQKYFIFLTQTIVRAILSTKAEMVSVQLPTRRKQNGHKETSSTKWERYVSHIDTDAW